MAKETTEQKKSVARVMHEYKHGELESGSGKKVRSPRQAVAIGLSEAGASNQQSRSENKRKLSRTKAKERHGETAQQEKEGRTAMDRKASGKTRADLYEQAKRRDIPGRSRMSKADLQRALSH